MEEVKRQVVVDCSNVPTFWELYAKLPKIMKGSKSGQNKCVQDMIMFERQKSRYAVEKADYLRKRKMVSNLDEFEKQIDQLVAKKSKQTAAAEKGIDQAKNILEKMDCLNKKSSVINDLKEVLEAGNAFVESEEKTRDEYMKSLVGIINIAYKEFIDTVDALLSKMPFLSHQKEAMADLDVDTKKHAELIWQLSIIKKLDGFNPLAEKTDQIKKVLNEKLSEKKKRLEAFEVNEKNRIQEVDVVNEIDEKLYSAEADLRKYEFRENEELQTVFAQTNEASTLILEGQAEYIELKEKLMECKDEEDERASWGAKLEALNHQCTDLQYDLDCAQCELNQVQQIDIEHIREIEAEENRIKSDEDQQQKCYEDLLSKLDEYKEEKKAVCEKYDLKGRKLDDLKNLIHLSEEKLSEINDKINSIRNGQTEKRQRKKALKREIQKLDEAIAQLLSEI